MTDHPLLQGAVETWHTGELRITCVIRQDNDAWSVHVQLPENLHGAWGYPAEVMAALALNLVSHFGQLHSYLDLNYPGWLSLHLEPEFADSKPRQLLYQDAQMVAAKLDAASDYLAGGEGRSVKPISPESFTFDLRAIRDRLRLNEDGKSHTARIFLKAGDTAADPNAGYLSLDGPARVDYEQSLAGLSATVHPM